MSTIYPTKSVSIAVGPQTMNLNNKITLHENLEWYDEDKMMRKHPSIQNPPINTDIKNLIDSLDTKPNMYIINSKFECEPYLSLSNQINYNTDIYLDNLHAGSLLHFNNVKLILYNNNKHSLASEIDLKHLFKSIDEQYLKLFDINQGVDMLKNNLIDYIATRVGTPATLSRAVSAVPNASW